ncbi:hypothetical protein HK101_003420 [Irineochytrium annulatum]|nr:hypothetical protein HK101_003420 [Irineochytrium annulatum]
MPRPSLATSDSISSALTSNLEPYSWRTLLSRMFDKLFLVASILHVYVSYAILRALTIREWWVADSSYYELVETTSTAPNGTEIIEGNRTIADIIAGGPLQKTSDREVTALGFALGIAFLVQVATLLRLFEIKVKFAALFCIGATAVQSVLILYALATFPYADSFKVAHIPSQGHLAAIYANACSMVTFALFVADALRHRCANHNLSQSRRKLIMANIYAAWVVALGGVVLKYIEDWEFAVAFPFAIQTLTTIGYGNVAPVTVAGRLFVIVYFLAGAGVVGFLLSAIQDSMVERAESDLDAALKRRAELRRRAREGRRGRSRKADPLTRAIVTVFPGLNEERQYSRAEKAVDGRSLKRNQAAAEERVGMSIREEMEEEDRQAEIDREFRKGVEAARLRSVLMVLVGYGDLSPNKPLTWEFWNIFVFVSVSMLAYVLTLLAEQLGSKFGSLAAAASEKRLRKEERLRLRERGIDPDAILGAEGDDEGNEARGMTASPAGSDAEEEGDDDTVHSRQGSRSGGTEHAVQPPPGVHFADSVGPRRGAC